MERADIVGMSNALREAFLAAGKAVEEKRTAMGSAFFMQGHAIGQFETRASTLRVRLWLPDKDRRTFESRPTFDADNGWLHVVSDEDVAFVRTAIATSYRIAAKGDPGAAPSGPRSPVATPWTVGPPERRRVASAAMAERKRVAPAAPEERPEEKKKGASRRPSSST